LEEHAVDPDKRRYAVVEEAPRHYIDMDTYGIFPFTASIESEGSTSRPKVNMIKTVKSREQEKFLYDIEETIQGIERQGGLSGPRSPPLRDNQTSVADHAPA
jgi:hypothetical protein